MALAGVAIWYPSAAAGGARSVPGMQDVPCPHPVDVRPRPGAASEAASADVAPESPEEPLELLAPLPPPLAPLEELPAAPLELLAPPEPLDEEVDVADEPGVPAPPLLHPATPTTRAASAARVRQPNLLQVRALSRVISIPPVARRPVDCPTDSPSTLTCAPNAQMDHRRGEYLGDPF